jgi:hypothetical protein
MKTLDGFDLKEGECCFVGIQGPGGEKDYFDKVFKAHYRDASARANGWDFTLQELDLDDDEEVEVISIWKHSPVKKVGK